MKSLLLSSSVASVASAGWVPGGVPASFDCGVRQLAYTFGKQLLPRLGAFEALYYALDLGDASCPTELKADMAVSASPGSPMLPAGSIFVDPVKGDDSHAGTEQAPLRTLEVALSKTSDTIVLRGGTYFMTKQLLLGPEHSGLTIMAYPEEKPILSGGKRLDSLTWEPAQLSPDDGWELYEYSNIVYYQSPDDVHIRSYGKTSDARECLKLCDADAQCTGFTWHDSNQAMPEESGDYANLCWGRLDGNWTVTRQSGHTSGRKGKWHVGEDVNLVRSGTVDNETIRSYNTQPDASVCASACAADPECTSWTWHDENQGGYANLCWGRLDGQLPRFGEGGHTSGMPPANIYKAQVPSDVKDVPGLQLNGERATRARYPNLPGGIEVSCGYGCMVEGGSASWSPPDFAKYGDPVYYTDTKPEHRKNDTAGDWFHQYEIGIDGLCSIYDPPVGYWCSEHPSGGGAFAFRTPTGVTPQEGLPNAPYADVSEMLINVWRPARWANWMFGVEEYNGSTFTFGEGGNQGARGENKGGDYFVENVIEELDNPGEFFFNSSTGELLLFYNGTGAPPADMEVVVPQLEVLINVTGTQWDPVQGITLDGLTFKSTRYTYMGPHAVPSAGDWALDRISALFLQGTEGILVQNSVFERLDGNAVMISGYNRNATVQDNDFAYIGGNAIVAWGYTNETENSGFPYYSPNTNYPEAGVDGTDGNHPRFSKILRNSGREIGLYEKQSSFYMQAKTSESTISGNVFFNGPRAGINYNDGFGGGDVLDHNLVFSVCRESGDHGPFNSWDRQPYLTTVRTGEPSMIPAWREIHHNFFIDNYSPQEGIDNDDGSSYYRSHDNFLVYGGQGFKADFGGHDNHHYRNLYGYVQQAGFVMQAPTIEGHEHQFYENNVVMTGENVGSVGCSPQIMHDNSYFTPSGAVSECGKSLSQWQAEGHDLGSKVSTHPADDELLGMARELLAVLGTVESVVVA